jgi:hypothetical protein
LGLLGVGEVSGGFASLHHRLLSLAALRLWNLFVLLGEHIGSPLRGTILDD